MKQIIKTISRNIVKEYSPDKNVLGILLFGSVVKKKFDKYSDVDIYILLKKKSRFSRKNFISNRLRVDIILNTLEEARTYLQQDKNNVRRITSDMLVHGKILFQRGVYLEKIQKQAKKNLQLATRYSKDEILMHKYSIDDFWGEVQRDLEKGDYVAFGIDSHLLLTNILEFRLKLSGKFLPQPNEIGSVLRNLDKIFCKKLENFYRSKNIREKKSILSDLVRYIYKKSTGPLPKKWQIK
ncbi:MAG: hypothetical protein C3F02_02095 [Parcubacteria group bacterium]|nr:MAG: hypothetical protein C3F02_02095 [Parcubacteria group bacterium]